MARRRAGWSDRLNGARLAWLTGEPYPAPPRQLALALLGITPATDGSDGPMRDVVHARVTYGPPQHCPNVPGHPQEWYVEPTQDVPFDIPGDPTVRAHHTFQAWALLDVDTGAVLYVGLKRTVAAFGKPLTFPKATFRVTAEQPA
jgi:hypothetical protein